MPGLFDPLTIRDLKFTNRVFVSPMCHVFFELVVPKTVQIFPEILSFALWHSPRTLQVSAPRRLYSDNVGIWARPVAIVGS